MESHPGENLVFWLQTVLADYEISPDKVTAIIIDNGSNIIKAGDILKEKYFWISTRCAAHTLQLSVKEPFKIPQIKSTFSKTVSEILKL